MAIRSQLQPTPETTTDETAWDLCAGASSARPIFPKNERGSTKLARGIGNIRLEPTQQAVNMQMHVLPCMSGSHPL
jgi:hypothetical protein